MECQLFKNRMLTLYKALENSVLSDKTSGTEKTRCAEIAASIAIDVLKLESEDIKAVKELSKIVAATIENKNAPLNNLSKYDDAQGSDNSRHRHNQPEEEQEDDNRKF